MLSTISTVHIRVQGGEGGFCRLTAPWSALQVRTLIGVASTQRDGHGPEPTILQIHSSRVSWIPAGRPFPGYIDQHSTCTGVANGPDA